MPLIIGQSQPQLHHFWGTHTECEIWNFRKISQMKGNLQPGTHITIQVQRPSLPKFCIQTLTICDPNSAHFGVIGN